MLRSFILLAACLGALPTLAAAGQAVDPDSPASGKIIRSERDFDRDRLAEPDTKQDGNRIESRDGAAGSTGFTHAGEQDASGPSPATNDGTCVPSASIQCIPDPEPRPSQASGGL